MFAPIPWLEKKYVDLLSLHLSHFKWLKSTVATFRCPLCGDSQKSFRKTRGYFYKYQARWMMKCHNCHASMTFVSFLKDQNSALFSAYTTERFAEQRGATTTAPLITSQQTLPAQRPTAIPLLPTIADLDVSHVAKQYVCARQIPIEHHARLWYTDDWQHFLARLNYATDGHDRVPRLVIPFFDERQRLVAVQGRAFDSRHIRYLTAKATDDVLKVYGRERFTRDKQAYVVEGPLDSLFLDNALAIAGGDIKTMIEKLSLDLDRTTFIADNEPRNVHVVRQLERLITLDARVMIWPSYIAAKDINDCVLCGIDIPTLIAAHTYRGTAARLALQGFKKTAAQSYSKHEIVSRPSI